LLITHRIRYSPCHGKLPSRCSLFCRWAGARQQFVAARCTGSVVPGKMISAGCGLNAEWDGYYGCNCKLSCVGTLCWYLNGLRVRLLWLKLKNTVLLVTMCAVIGICCWMMWGLFHDAINPLKDSGYFTDHTRFNIQNLNVLPTQCVYVFCVDLRRNSDYFPIQH
jgi:hypothetical protein